MVGGVPADAGENRSKRRVQVLLGHRGMLDSLVAALSGPPGPLPLLVVE
jgi:hypothetical protein